MAELDARKPWPASRSRNVLVADDEAEIRDVVKSSLERDGYKVWLAADGTEALRLYRGRIGKIDAVVLDVRMPRLDGPTTLTALRTLTPEIPCCFISGDFGSYTPDNLCDHAGTAVLMKPFDLPALTRVLDQIMTR